MSLAASCGRQLRCLVDEAWPCLSAAIACDHLRRVHSSGATQHSTGCAACLTVPQAQAAGAARQRLAASQPAGILARTQANVAINTDHVASFEQVGFAIRLQEPQRHRSFGLEDTLDRMADFANAPQDCLAPLPDRFTGFESNEVLHYSARPCMVLYHLAQTRYLDVPL